MLKNPIAVINDFSGGQDTKTPIISMGLNKSPNMRNFHCAGIKERIMKRGGHSKVNASPVGSDELDTYYPPGYQTYDYALRDAVARTQISMGFKPKTSDTVIKVRLWLKKTSAPTGNINIEIQTDSSGKPSGTAVTNGTSGNIDISTLTTSYAWYTFTFSTQPTLVANTQYHIVLQGSNTINGTAYASWGTDDYDVVFPDGNMSIYDAATWAADSRYNAVFEVYITGGARSNDGFALWDFSSKNMMLGVFGTTLYKMDKNSAGTPDGTWDNLYNVSKEVDYMEYSTDTLAQAAYATSDANDAISQAAGTLVSDMTNGANAFDAGETTYANKTIAITESGYVGRNWGAGVSYMINRFTITSPDGRSFCGANPVLSLTIYLEGSNNGTDWVALYSVTANDSAAGTKNTIDVSTGITQAVGYQYHRIRIKSNTAGSNDLKIAEVNFYSIVLQVFSETVIKTQGTYTLSGIAAKTASLNETLTRTVSPVIDLSNENTIKFDIRSSRTGSNIKIGIHDSGGTTTEITPNILVAGVFQTVTWDISSVANADKDAIDSIIITILNADADNTFYIDNFYSASLLTTSRYWTFADWQSGRALINTDIGLYTYTGVGETSLVSAAPIGKFIVIFRNYVFMAGIRGLPNSIRYCDLNDYTTWTASQILTVNTNDGDVITGMRILKGKLYIFKRYSIHRISYLGSNPTFQVDQILGLGCPAHYTIKEVELGGDVGTVLIFLTTDKKLAVFDGYNIQIINDSLVEESNDLFGSTDDQPLSFADMNLVYSDLFHAVVKNDTSEYILYCVLGTDTEINYSFVFDYKTGGVYPYDGQYFSSSCFVVSTNKSKLLYCAGYTGYMWVQESGNSDDGSNIKAYWVSPKIKPSLVSLLTKALQLGINLKEAYSVSTLNAYFQLRIDWNVSWTTAEAFAYNRADAFTFGKTVLFDVGTVENMLQIKISDDSINLPITLYGVDLYGTVLGRESGERAAA